jgi:threonine dehydratase
MTDWPITLDDVLAARDRLRPYLSPTPLRDYQPLDAAVGGGIRVLVKHENFQPTGAFKIRNGLSFMTALPDDARKRGVVAATRGNHGLGIAWAGHQLGVRVTICVPVGNNPEKNDMTRALGARLIESGRDYDESVEVAQRLVRDEGMTLAHSTNNRSILAGAGTMALEMLEQSPAMDTMVIAVGGGSQAVGAMTVARAMRPGLTVYAVQSDGAAAAYESWRAGELRTVAEARTFADGVATRSAYELTFPALREGLAGFTLVSDRAIADALRTLLRTTHTLVEGAGAVGLAGLMALRDSLAGRTVGIIISGGNIDAATLRQVMSGEL